MAFWIILIFISLSFCQSPILELDDKSFDTTIANNQIVFVEFYSTVCSDCESIELEYEKFAEMVKKKNLPYIIARINDIEYPEKSLSITFYSYPGFALYVNGTGIYFDGDLIAEEILKFIKKKTNTNSIELKTIDEIKAKQSAGELLCIFGKSEKHGIENYVKLVAKFDNYVFYHANVDLVKQVFPETEEGNTVIIRNDEFRVVKEDVTSNEFSGYLDTYSRPPVIETDDNFMNLVSVPFSRKVFCLFYDSKNQESIQILNTLEKLARAHRSTKFIFARCDINDDSKRSDLSLYIVDQTKIPLLEMLEMKNNMWIYLYTGELTENGIEDFLSKIEKGLIKRYIKSAPVPKSNPGPVYEIVASTFDKEIMDNDKDIVLLQYGTDCKDCDDIKKMLYNLAKKWEKDEKLMFAMTDVTANDIKGNMIHTYPVILFYPGNNKVDEKLFTDVFDESHINEFIERERLNAESHNESQHGNNHDKGKDEEAKNHKYSDAKTDL